MQLNKSRPPPLLTQSCVNFPTESRRRPPLFPQDGPGDVQKPTGQGNPGGQFGAGVHLFKNQRKRHKDTGRLTKTRHFIAPRPWPQRGLLGPGSEGAELGGADPTEAGGGEGAGPGEEAPPTDPGPHSKREVKWNPDPESVERPRR